MLFHNEEATQLCNRFGWPPLGMSDNLLSIIPKDAGELLTSALSVVIATNEPYRFLNERVSLDGNMVYSELNYIPAIKDNQITHINLLIRDVTVSKIIEKRVTKLATELRTLIDGANAIIIATDSQGYITDWNQHTEDLNGYSKDDVIAKKITEVLLADQDNSILFKNRNCHYFFYSLGSASQ